jgi:hypothetical protein
LRLKKMPGDKIWVALETAGLRVARDMKPQEVASTVFAYATLSILQDIAHPSFYAARWELVCGLEAQDFSDESLYMLFHVYLMHHSASRSVTVSHPAWLVVGARDAWMRSVEGDNTVSRSQSKLARGFYEFGVRHEVERRTDDGYFSMDIYLPGYDVAVEFDGPTHYYHTSESSSTLRDAGGTGVRFSCAISVTNRLAEGSGRPTVRQQCWEALPGRGRCSAGIRVGTRRADP